MGEISSGWRFLTENFGLKYSKRFPRTEETLDNALEPTSDLPFSMLDKIDLL